MRPGLLADLSAKSSASKTKHKQQLVDSCILPPAGPLCFLWSGKVLVPTLLGEDG